MDFYYSLTLVKDNEQNFDIGVQEEITYLFENKENISINNTMHQKYATDREHRQYRNTDTTLKKSRKNARNFNFMARIQLLPVKKRFIGVASCTRGRDAQIALIKNSLRALAKATSGLNGSLT